MSGSVTGTSAALPRTVGSIQLGEHTTGGKDELTVDNHRGARIAGAVLGAGVLGVGGALALLSMGRFKMTPPGAFVASLGPSIPKIGMIAAGAGALLATGSLIGFRPRGMAYDQVVEGSLEQATQAADKRQGDVGIVRAGGDDRWGLIDMAGADVADLQGADAVSVRARLAAVVSRDGDAWVRSTDGFVDAGAATQIDATKVDAANAESVRTLVGAQLGATDDGAALTLGEPLLGGAPSTDRGEATGKLFEAGIDRAVLVDTPGGVLAFATAGDAKDAAPDQLHARGSQLTPFGAAALVTDIASTSPNSSTPTAVGETLGGGDQARPTVDLATVKVADLPSLEGRRVSVAGSEVNRLGKPLATFPDVNAAIRDAAGRQERMLVVQLADGAAVFALAGQTADDLTTALQPPAQLHVVRGRKQYSVSDAGDVNFQQRSVPFQRDEPIGSRITLGEVDAKVTKHVRSFGSQREAIDFVRGNLDDTRTLAVIKADGPDGAFHVYELDKRATGGEAWDQELGPVAGGAWRNDDVRTTVTETENHPSTWGTDVHVFDHTTSRTVRYLAEDGRISETAASAPREVSRPLNHINYAFNPNEANGHHIAVNGKHMVVGRYLESTGSEQEALRRIDRSAGNSDEFLVLEAPNNRGRFHIYSAREGSGGPDWNHARANPTLASWVSDESRSYSETERKSGQHGTDVYHYRITETWRERHITGGGRGERVTDATSRSRDRDLSYVDRADPPPKPSSPSGGYGGNSGGSSGGSNGGRSGGSSGRSYDRPGSYTPDF